MVGLLASSGHMDDTDFVFMPASRHLVWEDIILDPGIWSCLCWVHVFFPLVSIAFSGSYELLIGVGHGCSTCIVFLGVGVKLRSVSVLGEVANEVQRREESRMFQQNVVVSWEWR